MTVDEQIAQMPEGSDKEKAKAGAAAVRRLMPSLPSLAETVGTSEGSEAVKVEDSMFDEAGFLLPGFKEQLKGAGRPPAVAEPAGFDQTVLLLEEASENLYANMKAGYKLLKRQMKVCFCLFAL